MKIFSPYYESYIERVRGFISKIFFILIGIAILNVILNRSMKGIFISLLVFIVFFSFALYRALIINKYFLKELIIDEVNEKVLLKIYKYDNLWKNDEYNLQSFDVKVKESPESKYKSYWLEIYVDKILVYRQKETGGWRVDEFKEILEYFRSLQNRLVFTNYIISRDN